MQKIMAFLTITVIFAMAVTGSVPGVWAEDTGDKDVRLMTGPKPDGADDTAPVTRMMLKVQIPVEAGIRAIENGTMGPIFERLMAKIKPEAAYFSQEDGLRTAYFVYVIDGTFEFAEIHEPLIQGLGARVYDQPALTWQDIGKAFAETQKDN